MSYNLESVFYFLHDISGILKPDKGLKCLNFNTRSLPKNYDPFINEFDCLSIDVVGFIETWLTYVQESMYLLDSYRHFFVSPINKKGGGFSLHVKNSLISNEVLNIR